MTLTSFIWVIFEQMLPSSSMHPAGNQGGIDPTSLIPQLANQMGQLHISNQSVGEVDSPQN